LDDDTAFLDSMGEIASLLKGNEPRPSEALLISSTEKIVTDAIKTSDLTDPQVK
jgi:hypothetical protein